MRATSTHLAATKFLLTVVVLSLALASGHARRAGQTADLRA